jgi:LPS export ABC transporter permease LptF
LERKELGINLNLIERYVWRTILPYFFLSWLLLTVIILLQQSSRYTEIFFGINVPGSLAAELMLALLPNILAFTSPMALLTGVMIGFGQLHGDSELIAIRGAGVSTVNLLKPALLLGLLLTIFTFFINFAGVSAAARAARQVAVKAALLKLESPLEPGVFSTDIPNYLVYAREGNLERGVWEKVFIHNREKNGTVRIITAGSGRIDSAQDKSELVLSDANVTTLGAGREVTAERVGALRITLETGRRQLIQRLESVARAPEEMGLFELADFAGKKQGKEKLEAEVLWHRRVSLAFAPLIFVFLGGALSLRFARGGRGLNGIVALASIVVYYLVSLLAEQFVRSGRLEASIGGWLPTGCALVLSLWWLAQSNKINSKVLPQLRIKGVFSKSRQRLSEEKSHSILNSKSGNFVGLLERDFLRDIFKYFFFAIGSLLFLYLIFTTFELWRFVVSARDGYSILVRYLLFLTPIVVFQIAPTALLITVVATYAVKSKRAETIAWGAAGQNVYKLFMPALIFAGAVGWGSWELQERVLPLANLRQDALRSQLRGGGASISKEGTFWFAVPDKIYSLTGVIGADRSGEATAQNVQIYQFAADGIHLERLLKAERGAWRDGKLVLDAPEEVSWQKALVQVSKRAETHIEPVVDNFNPFFQSQTKFSYLSVDEIRERLKTATALSEERRFSVSLQKHYSVFLQPFVVVLFCAPLAIAFGRRTNAKTGALPIVYAFGLWLFFIGSTSVFEQLGFTGILPPTLAAWAPLAIMGSLGGYLFAKVQN